MSAEELLAQDKLNFEIHYTDIMSIVMKDVFFSLNGSRAGVFNLDLIGKKEKFDIAPNQSFSACVETVTTQLPDKVMPQKSVRKQQAIIALGTLVVLAALAVALPLALSGQWTEFTAEESGFAVTLPGTPQYEEQIDNTAAGPIETRIYSLDRTHYSYAIIYVDFGEAVPVDMTPEEILDNTCTGVIAATGGQLVSQNGCNLQQYLGREVVYTTSRKKV